MTLRVLDYAWHWAHSYRLHALPAEFWYVSWRGERAWDEAQRPRPSNFMGFVTPDQVELHGRKFDLALAHLDQWCDANNPLRGLPFRRMEQLARRIKVPLVVIMHGTPDDPSNRERMLRVMGDWPVVCNSSQAAQEWDGSDDRMDRYGLPQFRAIIHGYDVDEFWSEPLDKRAIEAATICSGGDLSRTYHGIPLLERLARDVPLVWYGPTGNRPFFSNYADYRAMLARTLVYFSPTRRAPMPGARTEAMLSGCCVVTAPGQDAETFIKHGVTGFVEDTYQGAVGTLSMLLNHPEIAWTVGQFGRDDARRLFASDRYTMDWARFLLEIGVESIETDSKV